MLCVPQEQLSSTAVTEPRVPAVHALTRRAATVTLGTEWLEWQHDDDPSAVILMAVDVGNAFKATLQSSSIESFTQSV
jgi:hypothetical protein